MFLYGKNSVLERLKINPKSIKKIFLQDNFNVPFIEKLIEVNNVPIKRLSSIELYKIKSSDNLQGIIAHVDRFEYASFKDLLFQSKNTPQTLIFLDRIYDPQNLGAIIRTAACFGGFAVIIPKFKACELTESALHIASGGENYVSVSKVSNISNAIIAAKDCGYWIVGAFATGESKNINEVSLPFPLGLVLGSEGRGIRYGIQKNLDIKVHIPMKGAKLSFNVSTACAIFCHEISKRR